MSVSLFHWGMYAMFTAMGFLIGRASKDNGG